MCLQRSNPSTWTCPTYQDRVVHTNYRGCHHVIVLRHLPQNPSAFNFNCYFSVLYFRILGIFLLNKRQKSLDFFKVTILMVFLLFCNRGMRGCVARIEWVHWTPAAANLPLRLRSKNYTPVLQAPS